jgi:hypothetical protein
VLVLTSAPQLRASAPDPKRTSKVRNIYGPHGLTIITQEQTRIIAKAIRRPTPTAPPSIITKKLGAKNAADLFRMVLTAAHAAAKQTNEPAFSSRDGSPQGEGYTVGKMTS